MPRRMLRDWTDSESVNSLSAFSESLFVRLIMKADDYGCFHALPSLVRSFCFPLRENMRNSEVSRGIDELRAAGLIAVYAGGDGKPYLQILNFGQRLKQSRHRFPEPQPDHQDGDPASAVPEVPGSSGKFLEQNKNENTEEELNNRERDTRVRKCAMEAEEIANLYPKNRIGNWQNVVKSVISAINREVERGMSEPEAIQKIKSATSKYAKTVTSNRSKCLLYSGVNFFDRGIYNDDPETWVKSEKNNKERETVNNDDSSYSYTSKLR